MITLDKQIDTLLRMGYQFNSKDIKHSLYEGVKQSYSGDWTENLEGQFSGSIKSTIVNSKPYSTLYFYTGCWINSLKNYLTPNTLWWDLEFFDNDGVTEYIEFMKRMGVISRGELIFKSVNCYKVQNGLDDRAIIEFEVNEIKKVWTILYGYTDIFIQRFANLCEELGTKGKFTIYDNGGQQFVLDYGTENDVERFNKLTGLNRRFLKDTNHFSRPED